MKYLALLFLLTLTFNSFANDFPLHPDPLLTPGALCTEPDQFRYPERIAYCERDVSSMEKDAIFASYRKKFGYKFPGHRLDYKIDHFIPLCAGGSNEAKNLWPQHVSIYQVTDALEALGCEKLAKGLISQQDLINYIYLAKMNVASAPDIFSRLQSL